MSSKIVIDDSSLYEIPEEIQKELSIIEKQLEED